MHTEEIISNFSIERTKGSGVITLVSRDICSEEIKISRKKTTAKKIEGELHFDRHKRVFASIRTIKWQYHFAEIILLRDVSFDEIKWANDETRPGFLTPEIHDNTNIEKRFIHVTESRALRQIRTKKIAN